MTTEFPQPGTITALAEGSCEGASQQEHEHAVQEALNAIEAGTLEKVVVSRSEFWTILQNKSRKRLNSDLEGFSGLLN